MLLFPSSECLIVKKYVLVFLLLVIVPLSISAANYLLGDSRGNWQTADRSSAGLLPKASAHPEALIRVYAARTVRWRGIFAVIAGSSSRNAMRHAIAATITPPGATRSASMDLPRTGDGLAPRPKPSSPSMGRPPRGTDSKIRAVIENYRFRSYGDYNPWPGPNSNTFVQAVLNAVPELNAVLPPTAIGKDYPYSGDWFGLTPSRTGVFVSLGGYLGLTIGWIEGSSSISSAAFSASTSGALP